MYVLKNTYFNSLQGLDNEYMQHVYNVKKMYSINKLIFLKELKVFVAIN